MPPFDVAAAPRHVFFWSSPHITYMAPYEQTAFQAVTFLQMLYGFVVLDYSYQGLLYYRRVAQSAVQIAASAIRRLSSVGPFICGRVLSPSDINELRRLLMADLFPLIM